MPITPGDTWIEKRLSPRERGEPEAQARLRSEARLLGLLRGSAFPRLIASGEDEHGPWHRVERIMLPTLAERIARGPVSPAWVTGAIPAVFRAVAELHEAADATGPLDVVHGDPSPANLAIDDTGTRVVLLDLDLASWRDGHPPLDGAFRGTLHYVAPEVARGEPPTVRSDLFAFAATLMEALLGHPPRDGASFPALLLEAAERPLALGDAPPALAACLAHDPADRPPSARAVVSDRGFHAVKQVL